MPVGLTPIYRIIKGGVDITGSFNDRTVMIKCDITSGGGASDTFTVMVDNRDFEVARPQTGAQLVIELGYAEVGMAELGQYEINEVYFEGPPHSIRLVGTAAGMRSTMKAPATAEFDDKTVGDIIRDIAKKGGVEAVIADDLAKKKVPFLNQFNSSYHLMHELERRFGAVAKFEFGKLVFAKRDEGESADGENLPMVLIRPEHILSYSVKHTDRSAYSSVAAEWWDKDKHKRVREEVENGALGAQMKEGQESFPFPLSGLFNSKEEAMEAAKAKVAALNRATGEVTLELSKGDPWIRAQMPLAIGGMCEGVNGLYVIDTVTHAYTKDKGITTTIFAKPPGDGGEAFADEATKYDQMPLAGELLGQYGTMFHRQPGPI